MNQYNLFHGEHLPPRIAYQTLFAYLPKIPTSQRFGRPLTDPNAMLRSFIYRCLRRLTTISDLAHTLAENPSLAEAVGFDPLGPVPSIERFSVWLRATPNQCLQEIRLSLLNQLIHQGAVRGTMVVLDSSAIPSAVRENNLKTSMTDRFNKNRYPKADPEARLGTYRIFRVGYLYGGFLESC